MLATVATELINFLFLARLWKGFNVAASKTFVWEFVDSMFTPNAFGVEPKPVDFKITDNARDRC
ncbi:MAG TPA: hypothetical protein VH330_03285 [Candidatus Udaeobacter sp.]|jgi:hypothetical protein